MQAPPALENEARRLNRLRQLGVLDTEAEAVLDAFTQLASSITGMPIALISLIDHDRQWFKSAVGLPQGGQTPRSLSFCGHAIAADEVFEVVVVKMRAWLVWVRVDAVNGKHLHDRCRTVRRLLMRIV